MNEIKKVVITGDDSTETPVFLHIEKEESLNRYFYFLEDEHGVDWPTDYCLYDTPEEAEEAGNKLFKEHTQSNNRGVFSVLEDSGLDVTGWELVKEIQLTDPRDEVGTTLYIFYAGRGGEYTFVVCDNDEYLRSWYKTIDDAEKAGRQAYLSELDMEESIQTHAEEDRTTDSDIAFSMEMVGFIQSVGSDGIKWLTNDHFVNQSILGDQGVDTIRKELQDMGYEVNNQIDPKRYTIILPKDIYFDPQKIEMAGEEISKVIDKVTRNNRPNNIDWFEVVRPDGNI
jgi:hypothetical protein